MQPLFILNTCQPVTLPEDFLGFVIVYRKNKDVQVAAAQDNLLQKLIENGLKLKLSNFLFVNPELEKVRFSELKKYAAIEKCILMSVSEQEFGLNLTLQPYRLTEISGIHFIKCDSPEQIAENNSKKSALWKQLLQSFNLD